MSALLVEAPPAADPAERPGWWAVVNEMSDAGASPHTIAAALNRSAWPGEDGKTWHWRQVMALIAPPEPPPSRVRSLHTSETGEGERAVAQRSLDADRVPAADVATRIALHVQAGHSSDTIAARLNRAGSRTHRGTRWTARSIDALLRPGASTARAALI